jgi:hypothetical protein
MALGFYEETRMVTGLSATLATRRTSTAIFTWCRTRKSAFSFRITTARERREVRAREAVWHAFLDRYFPTRFENQHLRALRRMCKRSPAITREPPRRHHHFESA